MTVIAKPFFTKVQVWREDYVGVIAVNNPPLNLVNADVLDQLTAAVTLAESDQKVEVLALTATGDTFFSAGMKWDDLGAPEALQVKAQAFTSILMSTSKPVAALLNAPALGAGVEICLLADFRLGTSTSYLGFPEVVYGYPPLFAGPYIAKESFGSSVARKLFVLGDTLTPEDAHRLGVIDALFERQNFFGEAKKWLERLRSRGEKLVHIRAISYDPIKLRYTFEVEKSQLRSLSSGAGRGADAAGLRSKREEVAGLSPTLRSRLKAIRDAAKNSGETGEVDNGP
ncbi:MAG: enoyl-CoA hydratase/isomerase family protein [Thermoprotei archaeon]